VLEALLVNRKAEDRYSNILKTEFIERAKPDYMEKDLDYLDGANGDVHNGFDVFADARLDNRKCVDGDEVVINDGNIEHKLPDSTQGGVQSNGEYVTDIDDSGLDETCTSTTLRMDGNDVLEEEPLSNSSDGGALALPTSTSTVLCRGPGHVKICCACFHRDDRFGRSWRCRRECAVINGVWGPTVCNAECEPDKLESEVGDDSKAEMSENVHKESDQVTQISASTDFVPEDATSTGSWATLEMAGQHEKVPKSGRIWSSRRTATGRS
jgi:hypothetical protein